MKTYYLTLSKVFPSNHAKAGMPTFFEEQFIKHTKLHTIRANYDLWKKRFEQIAAGKACLSVRQWVGKPYGKGSTQREIVRLTREDGIGIQKLRIYEHEPFPFVYADRYTRPVGWQELAANDGLSLNDWREWFKDCELSQPLAIIHFTKFRY
ncbi:MAG: hypothetical protein IKO20_01570 [Bacteroidaceae bacterium]|nr:hypothetical protein [Bacteroidaceae bacterium]